MFLEGVVNREVGNYVFLVYCVNSGQMHNYQAEPTNNSLSH